MQIRILQPSLLNPWAAEALRLKVWCVSWDAELRIEVVNPVPARSWCKLGNAASVMVGTYTLGVVRGWSFDN